MNINSHNDAINAVEQDITNIIYVPKFFISTEIMQLVYKKDPTFKFAKYSFTIRLKTNPVQYKHIEINSIYSHSYYEENKSLIPENYSFSVKIDGNNLRYIPIEKRTSELCFSAVLENPLALQFVPEKYKTYSLCRIAVKNSGMALEYVPKEIRTPELCYLAITKSLLCWDDIPDHIKEGNFSVDTNKITDLKCYIRFTPRKKQRREYITAFFYKASHEDIKTLASFIASKGIPSHFLPLLLNIPNYRLREYAKKKLRRE